MPNDSTLMSDSLSAPQQEASAGRALNARVAETVMGWVVAHYTSGFPLGIGRVIGFNPDATNYYETPRGDHPGGIKRSDLSSDWSYWSPSTDMSAAWGVVEKMRDAGFEVDVSSETATGGWIVLFDSLATAHAGTTRKAVTAPLAICLAALAASAALKSLESSP